jgi:DNA-binding PadR family transcriptional regulator
MASRAPSGRGELRRANEPAVLILTSLASGPKHGYALTKDIGTFARVSLSPGTLYGAITRLEERGLIEPAPTESRRQPYRITARGRAGLAEAVRDMRAIADEGLPALIRLIRGGAWPGIRRPVRRAGLVTAVTVVGGVGVTIWAHHLSGRGSLVPPVMATVGVLMVAGLVAALAGARSVVRSTRQPEAGGPA